ncbi:hypothetical protein Hypma_001974 [Hypsizygus marmoreus]|uniref:Uncharacterized protein n=1 Tax=Hypsizygus marmoreus TaxID=39966 RepID=A0A369JCU3_HYPMA|nr:hypothetical protein Hypma_001974 [Hypsizygus marmoreus]
MTRSALSPYSPEVAKKAFRAKAKSQGLTFAAAAEARKKQGQKVRFPSLADSKLTDGYKLYPGMGRRNPGRMDGVQWNGSAFICANHVDGALVGEYTERPWESDGAAERADLPAGLRVIPTVDEYRQPHVLSSLLDIAKPAKAKGVAKEFEVIDPLPHVVVLLDEEVSESLQFPDEDDEWRDDEGTLWDEIKGTGSVDVRERHSYSAAVKGKGRDDADGGNGS